MCWNKQKTKWWWDCYRLCKRVSEHILYILARLPLPFWHPMAHLLAPQCCAAPLSLLSLQGVKSRPPLDWWMSLKRSSHLPIVHLNTGNPVNLVMLSLSLPASVTGSQRESLHLEPQITIKHCKCNLQSGWLWKIDFFLQQKYHDKYTLLFKSSGSVCFFVY